jgi:hypothetical protein
VISYEFVDTSIRDEDLHPDLISKKERELAMAFVTALEVNREIRFCPVCETPREEVLFEKWGYQYAVCPKTWSLSLTALPEDRILNNYFSCSELSKFRATRDYQNIMSNKRKDLWESQISWLEGRVNRYMGNEKYSVIDWGGKFVGWIEFLEKAGFVNKLYIRDSLPPINDGPELVGPVDIICLIDVIQREIEPYTLLERVAHKLRPGGVLIVSCRTGSGFDILSLRDNSENVFPLDHIFLPSPAGMEFLLEKAGFEILELTTPGLMDMKYIQNAAEKLKKDQYFLRYIMKMGDALLLERMQGFLQRNNLSSHLRCVAKRK